MSQFLVTQKLPTSNGVWQIDATPEGVKIANPEGTTAFQGTPDEVLVKLAHALAELDAAQGFLYATPTPVATDGGPRSKPRRNSR